MAETFDQDAIHRVLNGAYVHEYAHPKVSKENLTLVLGQVTKAVATLFETTNRQSQEIKEGEERTTKLENEAAQLRTRTLELEMKLKRTNEDLITQERMFIEEQAKSATTVNNLQNMIKKLQMTSSDHDKTIDGMLRAQDRQQSLIQKMKLDITRAAKMASQALDNDSDDEGGDGSAPGNSHEQRASRGARGKRGQAPAVDASSLQISSEQVMCQLPDFTNGIMTEDLVPLSRILRLFMDKMLDSVRGFHVMTQDFREVETELGRKATREQVDLVSSQLETACTNVENLIRGFHIGGILESPPPDSRIFEMVHEMGTNDWGVEPATNKQRSSVETANASVKLREIRKTYKSAPVGPYGVTQAVRDLNERFEAEIDAVNDQLDEAIVEITGMKKELSTKMDADGVDTKIEIKFDEVIDQLDKAISTAGADEEEFKQAAKELQETCALLNISKADQSDLVDIRKRLELDNKVADQVEKIQAYMDEKLNRSEADILVQGKVAKEELGEKLEMLHRRLQADISHAIDDKTNLKPFLTGRNCESRGNHTTPLDALTCLACNRKVTPGQMQLLRKAPGLHDTVMNKPKPVKMRNTQMLEQSLHGAPFFLNPHVAPFDNDPPQKNDPESCNAYSSWGDGMLSPNSRASSPSKSLHKPVLPSLKQSQQNSLVKPHHVPTLVSAPRSPVEEKEEIHVQQLPTKQPIWGMKPENGEYENATKALQEGPSAIVIPDRQGKPSIEQVRVKHFSFGA
mmetsp:Transcript_24910/g.40365  ORF Transcript_24910/g.40365 Transcript_24910/m.40365 type:complete len:744 (-) Transcript_24910:37-2268(-)